MDVTTAFLYGELNEEVYMKLPEGATGDTGVVCKLNKSLYGIKQSPRCWNGRIHNFLTSLGFSAINSDSALYIKRAGEVKLIIALYVDDMLILSKDLDAIISVKSTLSAEFKMTDAGEVDTILGIKVTRDRENGVLHLGEEHYASNVLKRLEWR